MTKPVPWAHYVTPTDQNFSLGKNIVGHPAGTLCPETENELHGHCNIANRTVDIWKYGQDPEVTAPYEFVVRPLRRTNTGQPKILIHPFGILHMYLAGKISDDAYARLWHRLPSICIGTWLDRNDQIVVDLNLRQAPLYVSTSASWGIVLS